ncbi:MAG: hypothetical protein JXR31_12935 [Prolixibacteraceae bacterium]|nr:hypothetical protein [Prolixibacteraceae bacterium]
MPGNLYLQCQEVVFEKKYAGFTTYVFISLALFFVIGEELSWGQRIFNIQSGEYFINNNTQAETNLHNLQLGNVKINKLIFTQIAAVLVAVYFLFSRIICSKIKIFNRLWDKFCIPLPKIHHTIFFYFAFIVVYAFNYKRNSEVMELIFPMIFMLIFLFPYKPKEKASVKPAFI